MSIELWLAFVVASAALLAVPGPTVMIVVSTALGRGKRVGCATAPGVVLGDLVAMSASLLGAGGLLAASAELFTLLKWAGAAYLIYLGIRLWRTAPVVAGETNDDGSVRPRGVFWQPFIVTALNPKGIIFFIAFVPQFVDVTAPVYPQFVILGATFLVLTAANVFVWAALAGELRARISNARTLRRVNRIGAGFMICAGVLTATMRRVSP